MQKVLIKSLPNQEFTFSVDGVGYQIALLSGLSGFMLADVYIDNELKVAGLRCLPGVPLIPYKYLNSGRDANFYFLCINNDLPDYTKFNDTQFLIYTPDGTIESELP